MQLLVEKSKLFKLFSFLLMNTYILLWPSHKVTQQKKENSFQVRQGTNQIKSK